ncbi:MAG: arginine--tRNA ligase, partial [Fidelibacterota bacterium]
QVEFVSANPTGPLSVGHGRQAVLGDTIANILQWNGYDVTREYYFNNAGRQMRLLGLSVKIRYLQLLGEDIPFPEEGYQGEYIIDIAKKIFIKYGDTKIAESEEGFFKEFAEKEVFEDIKSTLSKLGVKFDVFYNEHSLYESGKLQEVVDDLRKKGLIYEKDGAIWFKTSRFGGDKDRVIIKSSGEPTYRLPDIAYHREKFRRGFQYIVDIFGADHHATYPDVLAGLRALGYNSENVKVLIHQFVTLTRNGKQVKMSTRKANFVTLDELLGEVGNDVVRYFFLMRNMNSHLNFDLSVAKKESEENPVYYLQYAHARICNILKYAREKSIKKEREIDFSLLSSREEVDLMKVLAGFPDTVFLILESLEPQHLTTYLQELATIFHKFYTEHRVVSRDRKLTAARLALVKGTKTVLANGLKLLGISTPEYM